MKENSNVGDIDVGDPEEDIEYIEILIKIASELPSGELKIQEKEIEVISHILSDYKRVLKENEELKEIASKLTHRPLNQFSIGEFKYLANNFIPVQKVKDKIEELKSELEFETIEREAKLQIELLKSLLEED